METSKDILGKRLIPLRAKHTIAMSRVIALFNMSGGVGKSTLTVNLGFHLASRHSEKESAASGHGPAGIIHNFSWV